MVTLSWLNLHDLINSKKMEEKTMKFEELAKKIIRAVGGKENIIGLQHCMTRLRFDLKDESIADDDAIEQMEGVISLIKKGGQYQIVIGTQVHEVYLLICKLVGILEEEKEETKSKKGFVSSIMGAIIGAIGPIIPILIGTGLGKCILLMISTLGWANAESSFTYYIFNFVFDAGFFFMPVFVSIAAAKYFKCNMFIAALLGCAMVHPNWNAIVNQLDPKFIGNMFGFLPVYGIPYTSSLIPALFMVFVLAKVEGVLNKHIPKLFKSLLVPLLSILIMVPLTFVILAPAMGVISTYFGNAMIWIYDTFGMFALAIMCFIYPWIVATGMHAPLAIAGIQVLSQKGFDPFSRTLTLVANFAQGSACSAVAIKTKNKDLKTTAVSAAVTAFFAGITEPAIYGVSMPLKKPMIAVVIGSVAGGLYAGICGLKAFAFMTPSIVNFPMWMGGKDNSNLINAFITMGIVCVVTFISTILLKFEDPVNEEELVSTNDTITSINSPVVGEVISLQEVKDEMFAKEVLGKGVAINPKEGKIYAPISGVISATFDTKHAIGITTDSGVELLIHVGIDTIQLNGKPFTQYVKKDERVEKGKLLLEFDMNQIKEAGYNPVTIVVVTNSSDYLEIIPNKETKATLSQELLVVI